MSEIRFDLVTGEFVIMAAQRADRPYDFKKKIQITENAETDAKDCPFCIGNDHMTPSTIMFVKDNELDLHWSIKVIPNKYPVVSNDKSFYESDDFYKNIDAKGVHEVIVDTPNHNETIDHFTLHHLDKLFMTLQTRFQQIEKDKAIKYVQIFKNQGIYAGASKSHSHWQIVGVPMILQKQIKLLEGIQSYKKTTGKCVYCDIIEHELNVNKRVIAFNERFIAITPYASKYPYEIWILPKQHIGSFSLLDNAHIKDLSSIFSKTIVSLNQLLPNISFNICFEDSPNTIEDRKQHHWYMQIIPRKGSWAGFELATDCYISTCLPEQAASKLKKICDRGNEHE